MEEPENSNGYELEFEDEDFESEENDEDLENEEDFGSSSDESIRESPVQEMGKQQDTRNPQKEIGKATMSKKNRVRGLTRLVKLNREFSYSKGEKRIVDFDEVGRFTGKYRSEFPSFLGDLVRTNVGLRYLNWKKVTTEVKDKLWDKIMHYYEIDESLKRSIMGHLGGQLRGFRKKLYAKYILPNINKPSKLKVIPEEYRACIDQEDWDKFVTWTFSDEFKGISKAAKEVRAKSKYPHRLGRLGYSGLREKLVKNKELAEDELPLRSFMWRKARANKDGQYEDDDLRAVANKIIDHEKEIKDGSVKLGHGTDALTLVFGKDHCGRVRGVGMGVTPTKYWHNPSRKGSSKECIAQLQKQLDDERQERELQDEKFKNVCRKMEEQGQVVNALLSHLASQGIVLPQLPTASNSKSERQKSLRSGMSSPLEAAIASDHSNGSMQGVTLHKSSKSARQDSPNPMLHSHIVVEQESQTTSQVVPSEGSIIVKCRLAHPDLRNIVARGTIYHSSDQQIIHGVPLQADCYRVSIDESIKPAAFLPIQAREHKTVGDAHGSFVAWPKSLVIPDSKTLQSTSDEHNENQKPKKRKKIYITAAGIPKHTRSTSLKKIMKSNVLDK